MPRRIAELEAQPASIGRMETAADEFAAGRCHAVPEVGGSGAPRAWAGVRLWPLDRASSGLGEGAGAGRARNPARICGNAAPGDRQVVGDNARAGAAAG